MTSISIVGYDSKVFSLTHVNICSLRNKVHEVGSLLSTNSLCVLALSETHLDITFDSGEFNIDGYRLYRKDRNKFGGGVALYIKNNFVSKLRQDLMSHDLEIVWIQLQPVYGKSVLVGCVYRPPNANILYSQQICEMLEKVSEENKEIFLLGDMNINWFDTQCSVRKEIGSICSACNLTQIIMVPTRVKVNVAGVKTSSCIDHSYTNVPELCSNIISVPVGFSDHNLVGVTRKIKLLKTAQNFTFKRLFRNLNVDNFTVILKRFSGRT